MTLDCHECGFPMILRETVKHRYRSGEPRKLWGCSQWPRCQAVRNAHPDGTPHGNPGDEETKRARNAAHAAFDRLWLNGQMSRQSAYALLQKRMGLPADEAHIGLFTIEQCRRVVELFGLVPLSRTR